MPSVFQRMCPSHVNGTHLYLLGSVMIAFTFITMGEIFVLQPSRCYISVTVVKVEIPTSVKLIEVFILMRLNL